MSTWFDIADELKEVLETGEIEVARLVADALVDRALLAQGLRASASDMSGIGTDLEQNLPTFPTHEGPMKAHVLGQTPGSSLTITVGICISSYPHARKTKSQRRSSSKSSIPSMILVASRIRWVASQSIIGVCWSEVKYW